MKRGDVYFADLSGTRGSEQAGRRPVLILQNDSLSRYSRTIVVIPFTETLRRAGIPGCVFVNQGDGGLLQDSVALGYQIRVLDKSRFIQYLGHLSDDMIRKIEEAVKLTLDIN